MKRYMLAVRATLQPFRNRDDLDYILYMCFYFHFCANLFNVYIVFISLYVV